MHPIFIFFKTKCKLDYLAILGNKFYFRSWHSNCDKKVFHFIKMPIIACFCKQIDTLHKYLIYVRFQFLYSFLCKEFSCLVHFHSISRHPQRFINGQFCFIWIKAIYSSHVGKTQRLFDLFSLYFIRVRLLKHGLLLRRYGQNGTQSTVRTVAMNQQFM